MLVNDPVEMSCTPMSIAPRRRNPVATKRALLAAARVAFAEHGFAGARVDDIAERAGVNKQLVYHHYGDKDGLYLAVLERLYEEIRQAEAKLNLSGLEPEDAMRKLVGASFDHLAANPDFVALLNDENRQGARHVKASTKLPSMHSPLVATIGEMLKAGVQAGVFRPGINAMQLYISIAGLSFFFFSNAPTLSAIFRSTLDSPAARRMRKRHVIDMVMQALRP
jgi:TetR/AcrR family transcriptional regulator